jgi:competence protein ComEC
MVTLVTDSRETALRPAMRVACVGAIPFCVGVACGLAFPAGISVVTVMVTVCVIVVGISWFRRLHTTATVALLVTILGAGWLHGSFAARRTQPPPLLAGFSEQNVVVSGRVSTDPRVSGSRARFGIDADSILGSSAVLVGHIRLFARVDTALCGVERGDLVRMRGRLRGLDRALTPGSFDYGRYLRVRGYAATLSVWKHPVERVTRDLDAIESVVTTVRAYTRDAITSGMSAGSASLIRALVLGDRSGLDRRVLRDFQSCGMMHLLAVSGMHVGIILLGIGLPLYWLTGRRTWHAWVLIPCAWGFAILTGGNPPVVRAVVMASVFLASRPMQRGFDVWNALAVSAIINVLLFPAALFEAGFQLSYAAVAGIILVGGPSAKWFARVIPWRPQHRFPRKVWTWVVAILPISFIATVATAPLIAHHFQRVPIIGVILSLPTLVLTSLSIWIAMLSTFVGWIPVLPSLVNAVGDLLLGGVLWIGSSGASLPWASVWVRPPGWIEVGVYFLCFLTGWLLWNRRGRPLFAWTTVILLVANTVVWGAWIHRQQGVECVFLDVGQGDATLLVAPGFTMLVDGGPTWNGNDAGEWTIVPYCRYRGIRRIDAIVATHPDNDHIGGLATVVRELNPRVIYWNGQRSTSRAFTRLMESATERGIPLRRIAAGDSLAGIIGMGISVLGPPRDSLLAARWSRNDASIVLRVDMSFAGILLTGDAGMVEESWMTRAWSGQLRADVLKVGHHGSRTSTSPEFLQRVGPRTTVISVGRGNWYGHPFPAVLSRLERAGVRVWRTDSLGSLHIYAIGDSCAWSWPSRRQVAGP